MANRPFCRLRERAAFLDGTSIRRNGEVYWKIFPRASFSFFARWAFICRAAERDGSLINRLGQRLGKGQKEEKVECGCFAGN